MLQSQFPCLYWQKHQTDLTPAPEPVSRAGHGEAGGQCSPRQVAGSTTREHAFPQGVQQQLESVFLGTVLQSPLSFLCAQSI